MTKQGNEGQEQPEGGKAHEKAGAIQAGASVSADMQVIRGLNDTRLAVLGIIVTIGLTVGIAVAGVWWIGLLAGAGSFAFACVLIRWGRSRQLLMGFVHWLTGQ